MYLHNVSNQHPIYAIAKDAFYGAGRVKELHLSGNSIISLQKHSFKGLVNLEFLFLSENWLVNVDPDWHRPLTKLAYLSMSGNPTALCPPGYLRCHWENSTGFPCCTDKVGNEWVIPMLKEEEEKRAKLDEEKALNKSKAKNGKAKNGTANESEKKGGWFGGGSWF
jgi:hypothetical protein